MLKQVPRLPLPRRASQGIRDEEGRRDTSGPRPVDHRVGIGVTDDE